MIKKYNKGYRFSSENNENRKKSAVIEDNMVSRGDKNINLWQ